MIDHLLTAALGFVIGAVLTMAYDAWDRRLTRRRERRRAERNAVTESAP